MLVGVDVGGTFTDFFFLDEERGTCRIGKIPSTPENQAVGFIDGLMRELSDFSEIAVIVHGTTVGTNALLERKGARTGLITSQGFRDVLEMRRRDRPKTWGLRGEYLPIIPRDLRLEVPERVLADGTVLQVLDQDAVVKAATVLREASCEALAIAFVNAYANEANEAAALAAVGSVWPNAHITISSEILPEIREFERTSTTALNAYMQPVIARYLRRLDEVLRGGGFTGQILIVQSNGGVMSAQSAARFPVKTALSGPAAGVIACAYIATESGYPNVISCDMGGTSFDVSLIAGGQNTLAPQTTIDFGLVVRTPMIEITTIGAGGGSIAWVDDGGLLQIGPESAGSSPGPVCYGQGNERPTVTDANVVLGRINADQPIGEKLTTLDVEAARKAIQAEVAEPLGLDTMTAAEAIIRVANARMAGAIRLVSVERGHDPKNFVAMPFGGGGALHAGALIKEVGLAQALIPRFPGVTSALGCVIADVRHDTVRTVNSLLSDLDEVELVRWIEEIATAGLALLDQTATDFEKAEVLVALDMNYVGQIHTLSVPLGDFRDRLGSPLGRPEIAAAFSQHYQEQFARLLEDNPIRVVNLRAAVIGKRPKFPLSLLAPPEGLTRYAAAQGTRRIYDGGQWHETEVYARLRLPVGERFEGPVVMEQPDTTIYVDPGLVATTDRFGNLLIGRDV